MAAFRKTTTPGHTVLKIGSKFSFITRKGRSFSKSRLVRPTLMTFFDTLAEETEKENEKNLCILRVPWFQDRLFSQAVGGKREPSRCDFY
jgi:ATP-dependent RNA circularization protein (DNA/RNA ligase family)